MPELRTAEPQWHRQTLKNLLDRQRVEISPVRLACFLKVHSPAALTGFCLHRMEVHQKTALSARKAHLLEAGHPCHMGSAAGILYHSQNLSSTGR